MRLPLSQCKRFRCARATRAARRRDWPNLRAAWAACRASPARSRTNLLSRFLAQSRARPELASHWKLSHTAAVCLSSSAGHCESLAMEKHTRRRKKICSRSLARPVCVCGVCECERLIIGFDTKIPLLYVIRLPHSLKDPILSPKFTSTQTACDTSNKQPTA